jgi:hypothetical protein
MNRDELEQWMKDSLDKKEFIPDDAGWNKLQAALPVKNDRKKAVVFLLPKGLKIAASVMLLITTGSLLYFMNRNSGHKAETITKTKTRPLPPAVFQEVEATAISGNNQSTAIDRRVNTNRTDTKSTDAIVQLIDSTYRNTIYTAHSEPVPLPDSPAIKVTAYTNTPTDPDFLNPRPPAELSNSSSLNFGVAAQFGKANVGNMRYQFGVVAHQKISEKFYAEATIALASTEVSYIQKSNFPSLTVSAYAGNSVGSKSIDAQYGNNILSAGISPGIGYRIVPKLALGCGMTLYRNLNPVLTLQNDADIEKAAITNHLVSEKNSVSNWDAGLTGNAACNIGSRLTINVQYRYGLSTFMYFNNQAVRNSGFNMGLKYLFEK